MATQLDFLIFARDHASKQFDQLGRSVDRTGSKFKGIAKVAKWGGLAIAGAGALAVKASIDMIGAAVEDEKAQKALALQLRNSTGARQKDIKSAEAWITKQGKVLGVTDDELRPALARLTTATHDVGKAEELLSLGMDVSAGKQKSLKTVTEALARGYDGTTGSLGRLGVKTKDAEGNARKFSDIVKDLSKTFEGQASRAAETTAGKWQRVSTRWSEAREELGYKLMPVATDFADFLLDKMGPALGKALRKLEPIAEDVLPAMKDGFQAAKDVGEDLLPVVKGIADAWTGLPSGVQKLLVGTAAGGLAAKKLGVFSLAGKLGGKSGGLGGIATKASPLPVYVVNKWPGAGGDLPGSGPTVVPGGKPGVKSSASKVLTGTAAVAGGVLANDALDKLFNTEGIDSLGKHWEHLSSQIDKATSSTFAMQRASGHIPLIGDMLGGTAKDASDNLKKLDDQLSAMAEQDPKATFGVIRDIFRETGISVEDLNKVLPKTKGKLGDLGKASDQVERQSARAFLKMMGVTDAFGTKVGKAGGKVDDTKGKLRDFGNMHVTATADVNTSAAEAKIHALAVKLAMLVAGNTPWVGGGGDGGNGRGTRDRDVDERAARIHRRALEGMKIEIVGGDAGQRAYLRTGIGG